MTGRLPQTLPLVPVACELSHADGHRQLEEWRAFDANYLLETEDRGTEYVARYARVPDSELRLPRLVDRESSCCPFATWSIEQAPHQLRLVVSGTPESLAALSMR